MTNEIITNQNSIREEQQTISLKEFVGIVLRYWYWFVIGVIVCVICGALYIKKTPPVYLRSATVLVKDDRRTPTLGGEAMIGMDIFKSNSNVYNELVVIKSPALAMSVVSRLGLNYNYEADGFFHPVVLYGASLPFKVQLLDVPDNKSAA
ncbi:MAG: chain-length determining protein, partial [Bacteroidales bacterium]|nr:chain-length determining protein [Bacteroidales bacterium]